MDAMEAFMTIDVRVKSTDCEQNWKKNVRMDEASVRGSAGDEKDGDRLFDVLMKLMDNFNDHDHVQMQARGHLYIATKSSALRRLCRGHEARGPDTGIEGI